MNDKRFKLPQKKIILVRFRTKELPPQFVVQARFWDWCDSYSEWPHAFTKNFVNYGVNLHFGVFGTTGFLAFIHCHGSREKFAHSQFARFVRKSFKEYSPQLSFWTEEAYEKRLDRMEKKEKQNG